MKVAMYFAPGFEECEALIVVDMLRRAKVDVDTISIADKVVVSSHNVPVTTDYLFDEVNHENYDIYVLPGGMPGTTNLDNCDKLIDVLHNAYKQDKLLAAICAAPSVFGHMGILKDRHATSFPSFKDQLLGAIVEDDKCVQDGNIITACGLGAAFDFAKAILLNFMEEDDVDSLYKTIGY